MGSLADDIYAGMIEEYGSIVSPEAVRRLSALRLRYERLARRIDVRYATGRTHKIEDLEEEAERILEEMDSLAHAYKEGAEDEAVDWDVDLVPYLDFTLRHPEKFVERSDWINNMRSAIVDATRGWGKEPPTDAQVLEIARDAARRMYELRTRRMRRR